MYAQTNFKFTNSIVSILIRFSQPTQSNLVLKQLQLHSNSLEETHLKRINYQSLMHRESPHTIFKKNKQNLRVVKFS